MGLCVLIVFRLLDVSYQKIHTVHYYCFFVAPYIAPKGQIQQVLSGAIYSCYTTAPMSVYTTKFAGELAVTVG
jgi:hypothetical protein